MRPGTTRATFTVKSGREVLVLGEDRVIPVKDGTFSDSFSDYSVRLYKITR
jgi:hypothetical protein